MATDQAPAGDYVLTAASWDQLTSKPGEPAVFKRWARGETISLDSPTADQMLRDRTVVAADSNKKGAQAAANAPTREEL